MHNISKNRRTDLGLSVWSSDIENTTVTPELNLIRDQHQLFWECVWIWALVVIVHEPLHPVWPFPALYGTIEPLTPLHVQLSVFNLPSNSDDLGLHIDVVWKASLCFACAWIYRCRCLQELGECEMDGVRMNVRASVGTWSCADIHVYCICVCLQLPDKSRNLRQVQSICPWFEHCTNPLPTWSFKTKPRIHSLTPIKDKENMPLPYFLYLSCESYGKKIPLPKSKRCLVQNNRFKVPNDSVKNVQWESNLQCGT